MKKMLTFLGIETSCDETAASIIQEKSDGTGKILSNIVSSQVEEHKDFGGVVPEIAARAHIEKIEFIIKKAVSESRVTVRSASIHPRLLSHWPYTTRPGSTSTSFAIILCNTA